MATSRNSHPNSNANVASPSLYSICLGMSIVSGRLVVSAQIGMDHSAHFYLPRNPNGMYPDEDIVPESATSLFCLQAEDYFSNPQVSSVIARANQTNAATQTNKFGSEISWTDSLEAMIGKNDLDEAAKVPLPISPSHDLAITPPIDHEIDTIEPNVANVLLDSTVGMAAYTETQIENDGESTSGKDIYTVFKSFRGLL